MLSHHTWPHNPFYLSFVIYVHLHVYDDHMHTNAGEHVPQCLWRPESNFQELGLSFHSGSRELKFPRKQNKCLQQPAHNILKKYVFIMCICVFVFVHIYHRMLCVVQRTTCGSWWSSSREPLRKSSGCQAWGALPTESPCWPSISFF